MYCILQRFVCNESELKANGLAVIAVSLPKNMQHEFHMCQFALTFSGSKAIGRFILFYCRKITSIAI